MSRVYFLIFSKLQLLLRYRKVSAQKDCLNLGVTSDLNPKVMREYLLKTTYTIAQRSKNILHKVQTGFTLIELLVTLCVLGLMLVIALPSLRTMMFNNRLTASTDSLVSDLNYARGVALNNSSNVQVCPLSALNSAACGSNWSNGWIITTQPAIGAGTLLKSQQNTSVGPTIGANVSSVTFNAHGIASAQSNFTLCDTRGNAYARSIEVMATGFIQSGTTLGTAVWNNAALTCP